MKLSSNPTPFLFSDEIVFINEYLLFIVNIINISIKVKFRCCVQTRETYLSLEFQVPKMDLPKPVMIAVEVSKTKDFIDDFAAFLGDSVQNYDMTFNFRRF